MYIRQGSGTQAHTLSLSLGTLGSGRLKVRSKGSAVHGSMQLLRPIIRELTGSDAEAYVSSFLAGMQRQKVVPIGQNALLDWIKCFDEVLTNNSLPAHQFIRMWPLYNSILHAIILRMHCSKITPIA